MAKAATDAAFAKRHGITQAQAKEFLAKDKHDHSYKKQEHASTESTENVGEAVARVREFAEEHDIPKPRADKIVQAEIKEVSQEENVTDEGGTRENVDEYGRGHLAADPLLTYLDTMADAHTDLPVNHEKQGMSLDG